jgi:serine/threonine-protein kinase
MIGRTLRQYLVIEKLGQGGMGVVWKARDTSLDRHVALKVLPSDDIADPARKERFVREAKSASALNHPNIVTIYEINSADGVDFIAMEYVDGQTLASLLRRGALSIEQVVRYAGQIAEGVGRAHHAGIVHRDLKPGNVMITGDGLVKVLDFGLAKVRHVSGAGGIQNDTDAMTEMALTRVGTTVGTVGYMSPEQALGDVVDQRSDVFSFGVMVYEMLAGRLPFAAESRVEVMRQLHLAEPPGVQSVRTDTPAPIAAIVARAMAKQPSDRYVNLMEVAAALKEATSGTVAVPAPAPRGTAVQDLRRWLPTGLRGRFVGLAVCLMIVAIVWFAWRARGPSVESGVAPAATQTDPPDGPYALSQQAASYLARQDQGGNIDRAVALLERALNQDKGYAPAYAHLSDAYRRKHQTNPDAQWLTQARETAARAIALNSDLAAARIAMGFVHLEAGERDEGIREFRRAADLDPVNPLPHMGLGMIYFSQNQDAEAEAAYRRAVALGPRDWRPPIEFGQFYYRRGRYAEAAAQWETARGLTPDNVLVLRNLGAAYYLLGRHDEAASTLQRALEVQPSAATYTNLGTIRFFQGRYTDAVAAFEKAVELGANNHQFWGNLGDGLRWAPGRRADSAAAYRRASDLVAQQLAQKPQDPDLRTRHAVYLVKMGDRVKALEEIAAVAGLTTLTSQMLYRLTVVYELAGDRAAALGALERALLAGYPVKELASEPELISLRSDARYHRLIDSQAEPSRR